MTTHNPAAPIEGGYYAGRILIRGATCALIVAPKAEGEHPDTRWSSDYRDVPGAKSYSDGLANTQAMAEAGSKLAQWALQQRIGGFADWYIAALDELEIIYRALKPTADTNSCWARSGINLSAIPPTWPYTPELPTQTEHELYRAGGPEAFDAVAYWSSTQHVSYSDFAWNQHFNYGNQNVWSKDNELKTRLVRRLAI